MGTEIASNIRWVGFFYLVEIVEVGDEDDELVAANAGDGVGRADDALQLVGDMDQQGVAAGVAEGVVDALEAVDVDHADREFFIQALSALDAAGEAVVNQDAVWQTGQVVILRGAGDGIGEALEHGSGKGRYERHRDE